ncbi:MAG TPA: DUF4412 domain-containing protein [Chthoniobacterales bacterium]|nr:DUF4412 domain-containing protein [Chthoniobacterales bacterium]
MKIAGLCLVVTATLLVTARGDLTIVQKVEGSGSVSQITIKLKGERVRVEINPQLTTIIENKSGDMLTLMNKEKKFLRITADKSKAIAEMASKYSAKTAGAAEGAKLSATGKKEMINGYEAEEYVREAPSFKATYWISSNYPDSAAIVKQLQAIIPSAWNDAAKGMLDYRDFPGLPLRSKVKLNGKEITSTITSIKQDLLSDEEFSVPKDFQEMKVPNLQDMMTEKPSASISSRP